MSTNIIREITTTHVMKNNLTTVKDNIDKELVNFGGTKAQNLSKVPEVLNSAVSKNKKVAVLNLAMRTVIRDKEPMTIPLNIDFYPNTIYIEFQKLPAMIDYSDVETEYVGGLFERGGATIIYDTEYHHLVWFNLAITELTKKAVTLMPRFGGGGNYVKAVNYSIERIVAIG